MSEQRWPAETGGPPPTFTKRGLVLLSLVAVGTVAAGILVGAVLFVRSSPTVPSAMDGNSKWEDPPAAPAPAAAPTATLRCTWFGAGAEYDPEFCDRMALDATRRRTLTTLERAAAEVKAGLVADAVSRHRAGCADWSSAACVAERARQRQAQDPGQLAPQIRGWLEKAGFTDVTVRPAGPADPAPQGTVVFAVRIGPACVVGYRHAAGTRGEEPRAVGLLPEGGCLAG